MSNRLAYYIQSALFRAKNFFKRWINSSVGLEPNLKKKHFLLAVSFEGEIFLG